MPVAVSMKPFFARRDRRVSITIGKVAALAHVITDTLRYYEREGLIDPTSKSEGTIVSTIKRRYVGLASSNKLNTAASLWRRYERSSLCAAVMPPAAVMYGALRWQRNCT